MSCGSFCCRCSTCLARTPGPTSISSGGRNMQREQAITPSSYVTVCVVLVALTVVTVSVSFVPLTEGWHAFFGLLIGLVKATLVVLFFMHALHSSPVTRIVIA